MTEVIGIDHIYIAVSDLARSEKFYDRVLLDMLGFRKNKFTLGGEPHIQYFNRHFGYVLRPSGTQATHDALSPGLHHLCLRVDTPADVAAVAAQLRGADVFCPDRQRTLRNRDPDGDLQHAGRLHRNPGCDEMRHGFHPRFVSITAGHPDPQLAYDMVKPA